MRRANVYVTNEELAVYKLNGESCLELSGLYRCVDVHWQVYRVTRDTLNVKQVVVITKCCKASIPLSGNKQVMKCEQELLPFVIECKITVSKVFFNFITSFTTFSSALNGLSPERKFM